MDYWGWGVGKGYVGPLSQIIGGACPPPPLPIGVGGKGYVAPLLKLLEGPAPPFLPPGPLPNFLRQCDMTAILLKRDIQSQVIMSRRTMIDLVGKPPIKHTHKYSVILRQQYGVIPISAAFISLYLAAMLTSCVAQTEFL